MINVITKKDINDFKIYSSKTSNIFDVITKDELEMHKILDSKNEQREAYLDGYIIEKMASNNLVKTIVYNNPLEIVSENSDKYDESYYKTLNIITQKESLEKLKSIKNLEYDWDGYEAEPMNPEIYNNASKLIEKIIIPPRVFPTGNGSIQFEYHKKNNDDEYLEFEIFNNKIEVLFMSSDDNYNEYTCNIDEIDKINNLIKEFYGID